MFCDDECVVVHLQSGIVYIFSSLPSLKHRITNWLVINLGTVKHTPWGYRDRNCALTDSSTCKCYCSWTPPVTWGHKLSEDWLVGAAAWSGIVLTLSFDVCVPFLEAGATNRVIAGTWLFIRLPCAFHLSPRASDVWVFCFIHLEFHPFKSPRSH